MMTLVEFNREAFEAILVRELERRGWTAAQWAKSIDVSAGTLHDIRNTDPEKGRMRNPSPAMILKFADGLGVPRAAITHAPKAVSA